ncbi:DUF2784 domain-containing protein [Nocardiopsis alkaliphila]|uniref:DUF2784 domain-containing protein n=1 Tax=Nocardiopsis alkaliphila TaxID=225762 RepID=UPI0003471B73|nr:DUF2784 domain-containing protein [Nocardiopsis alkaliphila]
MIYRVIGEGAMILHMAFLIYLVIGGYIAWRWPVLFWPHLACALYSLGITVIGWACPLTHVENWGREQAGQAGLPPAGFIDHYLTGVIYPAEHLVTVRLLVALSIAVSWLGLLYLHLRRKRKDPENQT